MRSWTERLPYLKEFARTHRVLHLGPGREESMGVSVDISADVRPDVRADMNRPPYPFKDNSFDAAYAFSVVEHLDNFFGVFTELHRVLKPGGFVALLTPHFSDAASYIDPSHRLHLSVLSFDYFIEGTYQFANYGFYTRARYRVRERLLMLQPPWIHVPGLQRAVNRSPYLYEQHFCYLLRASGIYLELEVIK
jgi:SAM-dependent methyltransferase